MGGGNAGTKGKLVRKTHGVEISITRKIADVEDVYCREDFRFSFFHS